MDNFRVMPGMLLVGLGRIACVCDGYMYVTHPDSLDPVRYDFTPENCTLNLDTRDPATVGCLLALVRHAWGDPGIYVEGQYTRGRYVYRVRGGHGHGAKFVRASNVWRSEEAEALVYMLEAAL